MWIYASVWNLQVLLLGGTTSLPNRQPLDYSVSSMFLRRWFYILKTHCITAETHFLQLPCSDPYRLIPGLPHLPSFLHFCLFFPTHLINLLLPACHSPFRKLPWFLFSTTLNLSLPDFNTLSNLYHTTYLASFPMFFGPFFLLYWSQPVSQTHHTHSVLCLWCCYLLTEKALPSLCLLRFYLFFKILCRVYFLSAVFLNYFSSYCFAANSQVTFKLANQWAKMCIVSYIFHCYSLVMMETLWMQRAYLRIKSFTIRNIVLTYLTWIWRKRKESNYLFHYTYGKQSQQ